MPELSRRVMPATVDEQNHGGSKQKRKGHMRNGVWIIVVVGVVGTLLWAGPVRAQGGLPMCQADLNTCTSNLNTCTTSLSTCTTSAVACQTALAACQAGPNVVFPGDGMNGQALSYTDNGDGTFTDNNTLLIWELKVAGGTEGTCDLTTNLHGVDTTCKSLEIGAWIAAINAASLGGYSDWRVPNIKELQSIVDYSKRDYASSVPGSTAAGAYWSSTTDAGNSSNTWSVNFLDGFVFLEGQDNSRRLRAVRGGQ